MTAFLLVLVGLIFPTTSVELQLHDLGLLERCKVSCTIHVPWDTCGVTTIRLAGGVKRAPGRTRAWAYGNASLSTEMESTGKGLGPRPQDALLGLSHLLRLKAGMDLGTKRGHKLSVRFYPSPDLPPLEKSPCEPQYR